MQRREFLHNSLVAGAGAVLAPVVALAGSVSGAETNAVHKIDAAAAARDRAWFEQRLGSRFPIEVEGGESVVAQLVAVQRVPSGKAHDQFSVTFRAPAGADVSGLRWVAHTEGRFQLYLDPPDRASHARTFQAHFSLLT